jgi:hypothetical protein
MGLAQDQVQTVRILDGDGCNFHGIPPCKKKWLSIKKKLDLLFLAC